MPALEALLPRFAAANTQPLGISVDSIYCHANWAASLGGVSLPLLADFHPKGAVADSYGLYLDGAGITDRATVIIDASGTVRHISSVGPGGERDIAELAALCEQVDADRTAALAPTPTAPGLPDDAVLYVKTGCGFSGSVLMTRTNLGLHGLEVRNVTEDPAVMAELEALTGKGQAPCLVVDGKPMLESADINRYLVTRSTGLWS